MRSELSKSNGYGPEPWYDAEGEVVGSCYSYFNGGHFTCVDEYGVDHSVNTLPTNPYKYDAAANRVDSLATAVVGPGNRTSSFRGYNLTYDANGNALTRYGTNAQWGTDSSTYTWDALSRLTSMTTWPAGGAHTTVSFAYDALGRRVSKTVNGVTQWYAHDGDQVAMILDSLGQRLKLELGWAPGTDNLAFARSPSWTAAALSTPQNGTLRGLVSPTPGAPVRKIYDSSSATIGATWGDRTADTGTVVPIRMGGAEFDQETKLYYMRARYYDPQLGRFISEDPLGIAGGLNLYAYAENDPVNGRDPTGLTMMTMCHYTDWYVDGKYVGTDTDYCLTYDDGGGLKGDPPGAGGPIVSGGVGHGGGSGAGSRGPDRFHYTTSALKELYLCPRGLRTIQDVAYNNVTVTFGSGPLAGIPFIGSGSGNITLDFVRADGDNAVYAATANVHFDGPIGGFTGGVVGVHYARVDCTNGTVTGGGIGFLYS